MIKFEPETSPSLLIRIRNAGDSQSWSTFESIYAPVVRSFCRRRGIQEADVDDLVQDVMSTVAKSIRQFDYDPERGRFRAWFGTITSNKVKTFLSARHGRTKSLADNYLWLEQVVDSDSTADWNAAFCRQVLLVACERIKPRFEPTTWECFEITWLRNESAADAAEQVSVPIHTVYVNKSRVMKQLEAEVHMLAEDFPIPDFND